MTKIVKTVDLSGFEKPPKAVGYEGACQKMLWAGIRFLSKVDSPEALFKGMKEVNNDRIRITGICVMPDNGKELEDAVLKAIPDCSGAQHHTVMNHLRFIAENGLDKWLAEFKDKPESIFEIDLDELMTKDTQQLFDESPKAKEIVAQGKKHIEELRGKAVVVDAENMGEEVANIIRAEVLKQEKKDEREAKNN